MEPITGFQHLYLLGRSATQEGIVVFPDGSKFQHLYLLGRSATLFPATAGIQGALHGFNTFTFWEGLRPGVHPCVGAVHKVSTPLPSGKVCDTWAVACELTDLLDVSTPLPSGKVCDSGKLPERLSTIMFQHLYLLGRSATALFCAGWVYRSAVSTPLPSGKVCDRLVVRTIGNMTF